MNPEAVSFSGRRSSCSYAKCRGTLEAVAVPMSDFMKLTKIPIVIYYGDNIAKEPTNAPGPDGWRVRLAMARKWRDAVNKYGAM